MVRSLLFFTLHFDNFLTKYTYISQRGAIKIDERGKIQDFVIDTLPFFTWKNAQERKQIS